MNLAHPLWLWGLLTLPVFFALYRRRERRLKLVIAKLLAPRLRAANSCFSTTAQRLQAARLVHGLYSSGISSPAGWREGDFHYYFPRGGGDRARCVAQHARGRRQTKSPLSAKLIAMDLVNDLHEFEIGVMAYAGEATMLAPLYVRA
jgi:hypothetical protein